MRKPKLNAITNGLRLVWRCEQFSGHAVAKIHASKISATFLRIVYSAYVAKPSVSSTDDKLTLMPCNSDDMMYVNKMALKIPCGFNCIKTSEMERGKRKQFGQRERVRKRMPHLYGPNAYMFWANNAWTDSNRQQHRPMIVATQWPTVLLSNTRAFDYAFDFESIQGPTKASYNVTGSTQNNDYSEMIMHPCMLHPNCGNDCKQTLR